MAFPASNGALSDVLERACQAALQMRRQAEQTRARLATMDVASGEIINLDIRLRGFRAEFEAAGSVNGIGAYAQSQLGDGTLDIAAEFAAMVAAIDAVTDWIRTHFPRDGDGYLLARTWGVDGPVDRTFAPALTAGLRTQLDVLIATVA
ncbi:MAG: hypothetical protein ACYC28_14355 [Longimicrobiales bacterium]